MTSQVPMSDLPYLCYMAETGCRLPKIKKRTCISINVHPINSDDTIC